MGHGTERLLPGRSQARCFTCNFLAWTLARASCATCHEEVLSPGLHHPSAAACSQAQVSPTLQCTERAPSWGTLPGTLAEHTQTIPVHGEGPLLGQRSRTPWLGTSQTITCTLRGPPLEALLSGILPELQPELEAQGCKQQKPGNFPGKTSLPSQGTSLLRHEFLLLLWAHVEHLQGYSRGNETLAVQQGCSKADAEQVPNASTPASSAPLTSILPEKGLDNDTCIAQTQMQAAL